MNSPAFVIGGRFGDCIQLLPCFKAIYDRTKMKPVVVSTTTYGVVYDGVSYVVPRLFALDWWQDIKKLHQLATELYGGGVVPAWWGLGKDADNVAENPGGILLQCHGIEWAVDTNKWPNYSASMWDRCGFSVEEVKKLPVSFDHRNISRESALVKALVKTQKPLLLYNFNGQSSPFGAAPEVLSVIHKFSTGFEILDLGNVLSERIYDLLGLYDRAAGLITCDTATLHLANASKLPYIAFTINGWTSSTPLGNCVLEIKYNDAYERRFDIEPVLQSWLIPKPITPKKNVVRSEGKLAKA